MAETTPDRTIPLPTAPAGWSPPPPTIGVPAARPVAVAPRALTFAETSGLSKHGGQERGVEVELAEQLVAPAAVGDVEQERPRGVADLGRVGAGEPVADVILGQEDLADPVPVRGLVLADPEELGGGEAGQGGVGDHPDQGLAAAGPLLDLGALGGGPLVVPEQGGADHLAVGVEEDRAVHLAAQADARDVGRLQTPLARGRLRTVAAVACHQSSGSCSDQPGRGWSQGYSAEAEARIVPVSSIASVLVPDVPMSIPSVTLTAGPPSARRTASTRGRDSGGEPAGLASRSRRPGPC